MKFTDLTIDYNKDKDRMEATISNKHLSIDLEFSPELTLELIEGLSECYIRYIIHKEGD